MKVDAVFIERVQTGNQVSSYSILDLEEAKKEAANLTVYHNESFRVVVQNIESFSRGRKKVNLEKKANFIYADIKVFHRNVRTNTLEIYQ